FYRVYEDAAGGEGAWAPSHGPLLVHGGQWRGAHDGGRRRAPPPRGGGGGGGWGGGPLCGGGGGAGGRRGGLRAACGLRRRGRRGSAALCRRCRAVARWPLVGARRPHPSALGRRLCAREPPRAVARNARGLSRAQG